ncbi:XdhC/CoxI family protein [Dyadobacter luteus]|uniref:XdhC/CoxI family protein n=1 Tax=Dyadobacter luteus TaxID=2259619 RepID=A0A3D8Y8K8_9BACT|nr:XdhC/CoxI family protein [Dyadobacter luteus]REA57698.1 XdhC/CoxI family protein [Dyadobacter luteus]
MKEIKDIINAFDAAVSAKKSMALATVVHVEGSSYRRPGARMLVTDDGQLTGAISGGCLEGDALRKALLAISQQKNKLVTYDTTDDDDNTLGVQLGCNGIVHILFEPIDPEQVNNPIALLKRASAKRQNAVLLTLFSLTGRKDFQPGTCCLYLEKENISEYSVASIVSNDVFLKEIEHAQQIQDSFFKSFVIDGQNLTGFVEYLKTPPSLVIAGAGNDTIPLMDMASVLGWNIIVVDGRNGHATYQRFPKATQVLVSKANDVLTHITPDEQTFFVLMTHNYNYDIALLKELIMLDICPYIGTLGPKKKLDRMFDDLEKDGLTVTEKQKSKIFGPTGLDIGAETSEEIALSVLSEIKAVMNNRLGTFLREKSEPIHNRAGQNLDYSKSVAEGFLCAIQNPI